MMWSAGEKKRSHKHRYPCLAINLDAETNEKQTKENAQVFHAKEVYR